MTASALGPLAAAMAAVVERSTTARVSLADLRLAAAAVDASGPGREDWRGRIRAAIDELDAAGIATCPKGRWDRRTEPPLPLWIQKPVTGTAVGRPSATAWHHLLHWVPSVEADLTRNERDLVAAVNRWLPSAETARIVPLRERSWQLTGDDRALERHRRGRLFAPDKLTLALLRCRVTWPPVQQRVHGPGRWLIVENWSTFESLSIAGDQAGFDGRLIFGAGNQVGTRIAALDDTGERPDVPLLYFGDLDAGGVKAAQLACTVAREVGWPEVHPCRPLYALAMRSPHRLRIAPVAAATVGWARDWIGGTLGEQIAHCLARGAAVRQEAVGLEVLASVPFDQLVHDDES